VLLRALLQVQAGDAAAARTALQAEWRALRAAKATGPVVDAIARQLSQLP
jgi:cell division protein FtsL